MVGRVRCLADPTGRIVDCQVEQLQAFHDAGGHPMDLDRLLSSCVCQLIGLTVQVSEHGPIAKKSNANVAPACVRRHPYECLVGDVISGCAYQGVDSG